MIDQTISIPVRLRMNTMMNVLGLFHQRYLERVLVILIAA